MDQKCQLWVCPFSINKRILPKSFQTVFLFTRVLSLLRILAILEYTGGIRTQKPQKRLFADAELVRKTLEIFNLTTTNPMSMKLTTIMYLHESVNRIARRARNFFFWLNLIASLVKLLYKLDNIWGEYSMKNQSN